MCFHRWNKQIWSRLNLRNPPLFALIIFITKWIPRAQDKSFFNFKKTKKTSRVQIGNLLILYVEHTMGQKWTDMILILRQVFPELCKHTWIRFCLTWPRVKCQEIKIRTSVTEHSAGALYQIDSCEMELKVINLLFDSTSCCDRVSVAWQLPAAFRWLFWLRGKSEVALPSLVLFRVPAQMGFLVQIDVSISAKQDF